VTEQRTGKTDSAAEAIAAAIGRLGEAGTDATAAAISAEASVAYSTTNKKLRILREAGRAQSFDGTDNRTLWRLTNDADTGRTPGGQPDQDTSQPDQDGSQPDEDGSRTDATTPPSEQPAAGPDVTVVPADVPDQLSDEPDPSAAPRGDEDTDATTRAATIADVGHQLLAALDDRAGQPVVVPDVRVQAEPNDETAVAPDRGQAGPPDGAARAARRIARCERAGRCALRLMSPLGEGPDFDDEYYTAGEADAAAVTTDAQRAALAGQLRREMPPDDDQWWQIWTGRRWEDLFDGRAVAWSVSLSRGTPPDVISGALRGAVQDAVPRQVARATDPGSH
jgi:hypothetical protein